MIIDVKNSPPIINFDFGFNEKTVQAGVPVTVWLQSLFNQDEHTFTIQFEGAALVKVSNYEYQLTYSAQGVHSISLVVSSKDKRKNITSNTLTLTVV